ncbi:polyprenyl synthetase family protein [Candidatus Leptofilum sp.]|uniref:polyprenyl synthetase family protein n=1 Tax=Candidatus Leptofilum sp. TaxID=3241576 RepID=UPI003B5AB929
MIDMAEVSAVFEQQPEVAAWPAMQDVWHHYAKNPSSWRLPELACRAVGGDVAAVVSLVTAVACCHISIVLVDDILDDDPKGLYRQLGAGVAANLALAFQAVAYRIVQGTTGTAVPLLLAELAHLNLKTAQGQHLDVQPELNEAHYWATVEAKSMPYYGAGFYLGALVGGVDTAVAHQLRHFGHLIGKLIQVSDDLADVYQTPASPDWQRGGGNLAILYARLADHPDQARFEELLPQVNQPAMLEEAQQILLRSGAASYCVFQMMEIAQEARSVLDSCHLAQPKLLQQFLSERVEHLFELLEENNMPLPEELAAALLI